MVILVLDEFKQKSAKSLEAFVNKLGSFRSGRANPSLVENLMVDSYGSKMPLRSLATISAPEAKMLLLQVWDRTNIPAIEKAILTSDLGLSPQTEGEIIRLIVPALTGERRDEYKKLVKQEAEKIRVAIRGHRKEAIDSLKELEENKEITQDDEKRGKDQLQKEVDKENEKIEVLLTKKVEELNQV
jgi:ribosome recycling factor